MSTNLGADRLTAARRFGAPSSLICDYGVHEARGPHDLRRYAACDVNRSTFAKLAPRGQAPLEYIQP